jgi:hypothetical protein
MARAALVISLSILVAVLVLIVAAEGRCNRAAVP